MNPTRFESARIVSIEVSSLDYERGAAFVVDRLRKDLGGYVCLANVHMVMEAHDDPRFAEVVNGAQLVASDGMPLVWMLHALGHPNARRVYGPTFTLHLCEAAEREGLPIALYGGTDDSLAAFRRFLQENYPRLEVACAIAPPFRPLTDEEDREFTTRIRTSGARMVFVGIGCPKQERWMAEHADRIPEAMMFGVGAAFDFHSGRVSQAPRLLQQFGLEWAYRLVMEPRRLWRRYAVHNPRFVMLALGQILMSRITRRGPSAHRPDRSAQQATLPPTNRPPSPERRATNHRRPERPATRNRHDPGTVWGNPTEGRHE
jgi:N-acetylglucosaminyldiphosphoundecaprenol N-acetyl-beta-D-mannosaminyltransferase